MMTFQQLLKSHSWLSIKMTLEKLFPEQENLLEDYEKMFYSLKFISATVSNITIDVHWVHDDYDDTDYVDVAGYYTNPEDNTDEYSTSLAIEFTPWQEWLGMPVDTNSLQNFTELEIIAYCLNEMTYAGFEQEEIQAEINRIEKIADDYKNMTPEEKKQNTYTWEELQEKLKKLDEDDKFVED
jgi:hypothetical protein